MNWKFNFFFGILVLLIYLLFINYILETHIDLPEGQWRDTCRVITWSNPELTAECIDFKGKPTLTSINVNQCMEIELGPDQIGRAHV